MQENKPILAIETSERLCGASIYFSDDKHYEFSLVNKNIHSEKLFEIIDFLIKSAGIKVADLDYIAVSNGPGSFTGLRIGVAAVKGLALGAGLSLMPVPTFEALALQVSRFVPEGAFYYVANKVNTDEVYLQKFQKSKEHFDLTEALKIIKKSDVPSVTGAELLFGNAVVERDIRRVSCPDPLFVAKWAKYFGGDKLLTDYDFFEPDYIKEFLIKGVKNL